MGRLRCERGRRRGGPGDAWVLGHAIISGHAVVMGSGSVDGWASVGGDVEISGQAIVGGHARLSERVRVTDQAWVRGYTRLRGDVLVGGNASVELTRSAGLYRGVITHQTHIAEVTLGCSEYHSAVIARQIDGAAYIMIGCWGGTIRDLRTLIPTSDWPSDCGGETREVWAPVLQAVSDYAEALQSLWEAEDLRVM